MKSAPGFVTATRSELLPRLFGGVFGGFLGLTLLKFGNPPIMEKWELAPTEIWGFVFSTPWPIAWAYWLLGLVVILGLVIVVRLPSRGGPAGPSVKWLAAMPLVWLVWTGIAAIRTLDAQLTRATLAHFTGCVVCFYLGFLALSRVKRLGLFWSGLLCGFLLMLVVGWEQRFGGLDETRRYFRLYIYPQMTQIPPEYLKRMASNRIFSTLFYPNALAGALLLLLPAMLGFLGRARELLAADARWFLVCVTGSASLGCLYWSGSKGGWLLMLVAGLIALLRLPFRKYYKVALVTGVLVLGLGGFFWKYSSFFQKGATSVSARFDYWRAAVQTTRENPIFGTGPGTFYIPYSKIKRPESESSRLVHNDYLEQASDSGLPGCLVYTVFIVGALFYTWRSRVGKAGNWPVFLVWLGVFGWALQGFVEFGLYIPALAWPALAMLGWLLGKAPIPIDNSRQLG
jgi:O-antigen ligase